MSGRRIVFHTAVAVHRHDTGYAGAARVPVGVRFRGLGEAEIERYLRTEQPYDCAGSAKVETLGIALLEAIESDDPTALVGLPRPGKGRPAAADASALDALLAPALQGDDLGLISEAGLPAVADPGAALVQAAHARRVKVVPLPGPSALLLALAGSGLNGQSF